MTTGSLWLRSDVYYRKIEDVARRDYSEGVNEGKTFIPIIAQYGNSPKLHISGPGTIGQAIRPHYILSMHGHSISKGQWRSFGGKTFGIRNLSKLSAEILFKASSIMKCGGYRFGPVCYRHTTMALSHTQVGSAPIAINQNPPTFLRPITTDVLRKAPVMPFVEQDEWRTVVFTDGYLENDPTAPLRINVDPAHFYPHHFSADEATQKMSTRS